MTATKPAYVIAVSTPKHIKWRWARTSCSPHPHGRHTVGITGPICPGTKPQV